MKDYLTLTANYIVLHKEFFDICPESKQAGVILSYLYGWHITNTKHRTAQQTENRAAAKEGQDLPHEVNLNEAVWVYLEEGDVCDGVFRILSEDTFRKAISYLTDKGFIITRRHPKFKYTPTKQYQLQLHVIQEAILGLNLKIPFPEPKNNNDLLNLNLGSYAPENRFTSYKAINKDIYAEFENSDINLEKKQEEIKYNKDGSVAKKRGRKPSTQKNGEDSATQRMEAHEVGPKGRPLNKRFELYKVYCEARGEDPNYTVGRDIKLRMFTKDFVDAMEPHEVKELYRYVLGKWNNIAKKKGEEASLPQVIHLKREYADWMATKQYEAKRTMNNGNLSASVFDEAEEERKREEKKKAALAKTLEKADSIARRRERDAQLASSV